MILPDVRGLYRFYEELALRFAERGYAAVAIDYFGRTAGAGPRGDDFEYMPHVERTTQEACRRTAAAVACCASGARAMFTVGFCFGGRQSWLAAAGGHGLAGAVGFYGSPGAGQRGAPGPVQRADRMTAPILALQAGADANITADDNSVRRGSASPESSTRSSTYEGAPHSFFDRKQEEFADASADAWQRTLDFIAADRT